MRQSTTALPAAKGGLSRAINCRFKLTKPFDIALLSSARYLLHLWHRTFPQVTDHAG